MEIQVFCSDCVDTPFLHKIYNICVVIIFTETIIQNPLISLCIQVSYKSIDRPVKEYSKMRF